MAKAESLMMQLEDHFLPQSLCDGGFIKPPVVASKLVTTTLMIDSIKSDLIKLDNRII